MKAWRRDGDSLRCAMLSEEADMLANLGRQVLGLHRAVIDRRAVLDDPVMARLGEVRLVLHVRTGQDKAELTPGVTDEDIAQLRDVIAWLAFVQGTLLEAVE